MRRMFLGVILLSLLLLLSGCFQDLVKKDLEEYLAVEQKVTEEFSDPEILEKVLFGVSTESFETYLAQTEELENLLVKAQKKYQSLKPQSEEMKILISELQKAVKELVLSVQNLKKLLYEGDAEQIMQANDQILIKMLQLGQVQEKIHQLAEEKGFQLLK